MLPERNCRYTADLMRTIESRCQELDASREDWRASHE